MNDDDSPWEYKSDQPDNDYNETGNHRQSREPAAKPAAESITWEALEYIDHERGFGWYLALVVCTAALSALIYLITRDVFATGVVIVLGIILGVFVNQKPGRATYEIDRSGMRVNGKLFRFSSYKSFSIISEDGLNSVNLFPLKRFAPPLSAYFDPKEGPKIMETLGNYLPYDERGLDAIDRLTRRLRI